MKLIPVLMIEHGNQMDLKDLHAQRVQTPGAFRVYYSRIHESH